MVIKIKIGKKAQRGKKSNNNGYSPYSDVNQADKEVHIEPQAQTLDIRKNKSKNLKKKDEEVMDEVLKDTASTSNPQSLPTMNTLEIYHELLMEKIELLVDTLKSKQIVRSRSKALILEIIRSGTITPEQVDRLDASCISLLVSRLPILRLERKGTEYKVVLNDFSS